MNPRSGLILVLALAIPAEPVVLSAQTVEEEAGATRWRRWALAGAGALLLGGVATLTDQAGEQARTGVCDTTGCVVAVAGLLGAGLGFLLGSELDGRAVRRAREGPTLEADLTSVDLADGVTSLIDSKRGLFTIARQSVELVDDSFVRQPVVEGFQARTGTVAMDGDLLILASNTQVVGVPLPARDAPPVPLSETGASSLLTLDERAIALGEPGRIRRMDVMGSSEAPTLLENGTAATTGLPAALVLGAGGAPLWTLEEPDLVSRNPSTLAEIGRVELPARGTALSLAGPLALVSMGNAGVAMVDISDPRAPTVGRVLGGMEFAYDAVALDGRLYVAAGPQGIFVFEAGTGEATPLGVIRETDFAGDLLVKDGRLYILDRAANKLFRL